MKFSPRKTGEHVAVMKRWDAVINMCKATQEAQTRERNASENEPRFLRSLKLHRPIPLKESAVQIILPKMSKKNLD